MSSLSRLPCYQDLLSGEGKTQLTSMERFGEWISKFEQLIDSLMRLICYFDCRKPAEKDSPDSWFFAFAYEKYVEAPHSFRACHSLMESGHYLNAFILLRSILDYFVSCRYLYNKPEHVFPYCKGEKCLVFDSRSGKSSNRHISIADIYNLFSSDFYRRFYGDILSKISHGKAGVESFRIIRKGPEPRVIMVPEFNSGYARVLINHFTPILYGYFNCFKSFFDGRLLVLPLETEKDLKDSIIWLREKHSMNLNQENQIWHKEINNIIGF